MPESARGSQKPAHWTLASTSAKSEPDHQPCVHPVDEQDTMASRIWTGAHSSVRLLWRPPLSASAAARRRASRIRIEEVRFSYEDFRYRTPYRFGAQTVDRVTLLNVDCTVRTGRRRVWRAASGR